MEPQGEQDAAADIVANHAQPHGVQPQVEYMHAQEGPEDADSPHADEAVQEGEARVARAVEDAFQDDGNAEHRLGQRDDAQRGRAERDDIGIWREELHHLP